MAWRNLALILGRCAFVPKLLVPLLEFIFLGGMVAHAGPSAISIESARSQIEREGALSPARLVYFSAAAGFYQSADADALRDEMSAQPPPVFVVEDPRSLRLLQEARRRSAISARPIYLVLSPDEMVSRPEVPSGVQLVTYSGAPPRLPNPYGDPPVTRRTDAEGRDLLVDLLLGAARSGHVDSVALVDYAGSHSFAPVALNLLARLRHERWEPRTAPLALRAHHLLRRQYGIGSSVATLGLLANWPRLIQLLISTPEGARAIEYLSLDFRSYVVERTDGRTDRPPPGTAPPYRLHLKTSYPGRDGGKSFLDDILEENFRYWSRSIQLELDARSLTRSEPQSLVSSGTPRDFTAALAWRHHLSDEFTYPEAVELARLERSLFAPDSIALARARRGERVPDAATLGTGEETFARRVAEIGLTAATSELAVFSRLNEQFIALAHAPDPGPRFFDDNLDPLYGLRNRCGHGGLGDLGGRFRDSFEKCPDLLFRIKHGFAPPYPPPH